MPVDEDTRRRLRRAHDFLVAGLERLPLPKGLSLSLDCGSVAVGTEAWILDLRYTGDGGRILRGRTMIRLPDGIGPNDPLWGRLLAKGLARAIGSLAEQQTRGPVLAIWQPVVEDSQATEGPRLLSWGFF